MFLVIVDCVDMEYSYKLKDEEALDILKVYHRNKDINLLEKDFKEYLKKYSNDFEYRENIQNLFKHLKTAKNFGWNCNLFIKKVNKK